MLRLPQMQMLCITEHNMANFVTFILLFGVQVGILVFAVAVFINGFFNN